MVAGMSDDDQKPIKRSRWVNGSGVPRYDQRTQERLDDIYIELPDWRQGARIGKPK